MDETYELAKALAGDLAENYMAANISGMMIAGGKEKAKAIRKLSEDNTDQLNSMVQEYRGVERAIYSSMYKMIEGYNGYKIVRDT